MDVVLLDRVDYRGKDYVDVVGTVEVHEVEWKLGKSICKVFVSLQVLIQFEIAVLVEHGCYENLVSNLEAAPKNSDVLLA